MPPAITAGCRVAIKGSVTPAPWTAASSGRRVIGRFRCGQVVSLATGHSGLQLLLPSGAPGGPGNIRRWRGIRERPHLPDNAFKGWPLAAHMSVDRSAHRGYVLGCSAATAPDDAGTGVHGECGVSGHQLRRAGINAFGDLEMWYAAVALYDECAR